MNLPTNTKTCTCMKLFMSDIQRDHLEKSEGKTAIVLYIVPSKGLPYGATHVVYQGIPGAKPNEHPIIGHAKDYLSGAVPAELQTPDLFQ